MSSLDQLQPIFPLEIFSLIIDRIGDRTSAGLLPSDEDLDVLRVCSLVCHAFLPLCRARIFQCVIFGFTAGREMRIDRLIDLLDSQPVLKQYIHHLVIGLTDLHYKWPPSADYAIIPVSTLNFGTLLDLPNVSTVSLLHPKHHNLDPGHPHDNEDWGFQIIEAYAKKGTLRNLSLRLSFAAPFEVIYYHTSLYTLRVDGILPPAIRSPSMKSLTLRNVQDISTSVLSLYSDLESLEVLSTEFINPSDFDDESMVPPAPPTPPFRLKVLRMEQIRLSEQWLHSRFCTCVVNLVHHIRDSAKLHGVRPFAHLESLSMTLYPSSSSSQKLLKEVEYFFGNAPSLCQFDFQVSPLGRIPLRDLLHEFQNANVEICLRCLPVTSKRNSIPKYSMESLSTTTRVFASMPGSFPIDSMMDLADQSNGTGDDRVNIDNPPGKLFVDTWEEIVALIRARDTKGSNVVHSVELRLIYFCVTPDGKGGKTRQEIEDSIESVYNADGVLLGATVDGLSGDEPTGGKIVFLLDPDSLPV